MHTTKAVLRPNIVVVGGGHAGISAALRLASLPWTRLTRPQITLIDRQDRFCFLPMLYELALGQVEKWEIAPKFEDLLLDSPVKFLHGEVDNFDFPNNAVEGTCRSKGKSDSFTIPCDRAVLAVGGRPAGLGTVPGAQEHAIPFYTLHDSLRLKERLASIKKSKSSGEVINIIVVGGGYSGVEIASCLADDLGTSASVMIVETSDRILKRGTAHNRVTAEKALISNGAVVEYGSRVTDVTGSSVTIEKSSEGESERSQYPADLVLWTAGSKPSEALRNFDVPLDEQGRIITDQLLQVEGKPDAVYALGDAASASSGGKYFGTAQIAVQQAEYAAWNAWASLTENPKLEYRYAHLGEMMVLGSRNATVTTSVGLELEGSAAWAARRIAYLARMPTDRHRARVATSWAANPLLSGMSDFVKETRKYRTVL